MEVIGAPRGVVADTAQTLRLNEVKPICRHKSTLLDIETGGRWSDEAVQFICLLAHARAGAVPPSLRQAAAQALIRRCNAILTKGAVAPLAESITGAPARISLYDPPVVTCSEPSPPDYPSVPRERWSTLI